MVVPRSVRSAVRPARCVGVSSIAFHTRDATSRVSGAERAHAHLLCDGLALSVISDPFPSSQHRLAALIPDPEDAAPLTRQYWQDRGHTHDVPALQEGAARRYLSRSHIRSDTSTPTLVFGGGTHRCADLVANTAVALGSAPVALLSKLHTYCERHAWIAEGDRAWLAQVIDAGRASNVLRADMGWEDVAAHLRDIDAAPGEVFTSYSVGESFPSMTAAAWMEPAWPAAMVADGSYDYDRLDEAGRVAVDERSNAWDDLEPSQRWELAAAPVMGRPWLRIGPATLTRPTCRGATSLLDALASREWRTGAAGPLTSST